MDPVKIEIFKTDNGKEPFTEWIDSIRDQTTRDKILRRLRRVENGNVGSFKPLVTPNAICEFRFGFGAGYRIYFRFLSRSNILILCGVINHHKNLTSNVPKIITHNIWRISYETI